MEPEKVEVATEEIVANPEVATVSPENDSPAVSSVPTEPKQDELETGTARTDIPTKAE